MLGHPHETRRETAKGKPDSAVNLLAITYGENHDEQDPIVDFVNDAVISNR